MECPEPRQIGAFFHKHGYFPEYSEWKNQGTTHLQPPHIYLTMPRNYLRKAFADPITAFMSLWKDDKEYCYLDEDPPDEDVWHELAQLIECFKLY